MLRTGLSEKLNHSPGTRKLSGIYNFSNLCQCPSLHHLLIAVDFVWYDVYEGVLAAELIWLGRFIELPSIDWIMDIKLGLADAPSVWATESAPLRVNW
jgi:hypothetical protein